MCGRYIIDDGGSSVDIIDLLNELRESYGSGAVKTGEIFPTNSAPVLCKNDNRIAPRPAVWGFPKWKGSGVIINSRSETAMEKAMFKEPLAKRRCIIPSTGFFEWNKAGGSRKDKFRFNMPGEEALYMAGMTSLFDYGDTRREAFVILTTGANDSMSPVHDRMPVILRHDELEGWISDDSFAAHVLKRRAPELISQLVGTD